MALQSVVDARLRRQKLLAQRTAVQMAKLWRQVDTGSIAASWRAVLPAALAALTTSQATAAAGAGVYVDAALEAQNIAAVAEGRVAAATFAGVASDGRELVSLLYEPAVRSLIAIRDGATPARARAAGLLSLDVITRTQIADAGRAAELVAVAARPKVQGYVRMLSQPSCSRCIILAGRWYRWNASFKRHPRCDCRGVPSQENVAGDISTDPKKLFASLPLSEQDRIFGKAGADALREGADMSKIVNADRGVYEMAGRRFTHTAAGRRPRLMPTQIFKEAKGNRAEAIRLLRLHGYIH